MDAMRRLVLLLAVVFLGATVPVAAQKATRGNFVLSIQGGGLGNLEDRFFKSLSILFGGGLDYYPIAPISGGVQFQFSTKGNYGSPVAIGVGTLAASGSRASSRLFQTAFLVKPTLPLGADVRLFGLAGATFTKITGVSGSQTGEGDKFGGKFGAGAYVHLKSNVHLNLVAAFDTQPQKLFSTQTGLSFFFNPFSPKNAKARMVGGR